MYDQEVKCTCDNVQRNCNGIMGDRDCTNSPVSPPSSKQRSPGGDSPLRSSPMVSPGEFGPLKLRKSCGEILLSRYQKVSPVMLVIYVLVLTQTSSTCSKYLQVYKGSLCNVHVLYVQILLYVLQPLYILYDLLISRRVSCSHNIDTLMGSTSLY